MRLTKISVLLALAALAAGCRKIPFDQDHYKIISFADSNFKDRITPYYDSNGDGYISVNEAENGRRIPYGGGSALSVVIDCDNSGRDHAPLFGIEELKFFKNVEILRFSGNNISGTLDFKMLKSLKDIDFTDNAGITKIIINSLIQETLVVAKEPGTEIEYYLDPADEDGLSALE